ncbi:hypothetical protein ACQFX9_14320 [Aliinostoc sp. HNIBRCY26]|uniref:hypothetical protein n=1 Tax=Aliinostoc sp. HNIBRCY26 TaxID=3418997 RepID=UPI003CFFDEA3
MNNIFRNLTSKPVRTTLLGATALTGLGTLNIPLTVAAILALEIDNAVTATQQSKTLQKLEKIADRLEDCEFQLEDIEELDLQEQEELLTKWGFSERDFN